MSNLSKIRNRPFELAKARHAKSCRAAAELEFRKGYYLAVANIIRLHGEDVVAEDVLTNYGGIDFTGIDPYDLEVLKPLADHIKRKREAMDRLIKQNLAEAKAA